MLIVVLLILVIFLISCDNKWLRDIKNKIPGLASDVKDAAEDAVDAVAVDVVGTVADAAAIVEQAAAIEEEKLAEGFPYELSSQDPMMSTISGFTGSKDPINTWEPSTSDFAGGSNIYRTYAEDLKANVDSAIVASHQEYTEDAAFLASTGASHASTRDDFNPAVKFYGLPRAAHYSNLGAQKGSRTGQTETPDAVIDIAKHNTTGYVL